MNQPKSRIVPLSPDHARRLADGIEQHEASFITPKGDGWLTPTERIYIASLLRNAAASESRSIEDTVTLPLVPPENWFRPFIMCPADEVLIAWQAFLKIAEKFRGKL